MVGFLSDPVVVASGLCSSDRYFMGWVRMGGGDGMENSIPVQNHSNLVKSQKKACMGWRIPSPFK